MTFRCRIACVALAAGLSTAGWAQDQPQPKPQDNAAPPPQGAQNAAPQKTTDGAIIVNPISTNLGAQADAQKLDAKYTAAAPHVQLSSEHLSNATRMMLIRGLEAEFVFLRRTFPFSEVGLTLKANTNQVGPDPVTIQREVASHGAAARPGDRGQITAITIKDKSIVFELNGGPKKKSKWYQRIQIGGAGGMTPVAQGPDNSMAHGSYLTLEFDKYIPEMTVEQAKQLLSPVFDFSAKSATQAYADIMPPKVKAALKEHRALVGMTREMVTSAKGRPDQKLREKDENGDDYEEWIYGAPPKDVEFVRFVGDEVVRIEDMPVAGEKVIRTAREVDFPPGQVPGTASAVIAQSAEGEPGPSSTGPAGQQQASTGGAAGKPSLRRPGEPATDPGQAPLPGETKQPTIRRAPTTNDPTDPNSQYPDGQLPSGPPLPMPSGAPGQGQPGQPMPPGQTPGLPPL